MSGSHLALMVWLSPAFPVGAFAYSHGLEWAHEAGDLTDAASLEDWLGSLLAFGAWFSLLTAIVYARYGLLFKLAPDGWPMSKRYFPNA